MNAVVFEKKKWNSKLFLMTPLLDSERGLHGSHPDKFPVLYTVYKYILYYLISNFKSFHFLYPIVSRAEQNRPDQ